MNFQGQRIFFLLDDEVEIELVEEEPPFLQGQTKLTINVSPIKIVKVRWCILFNKGNLRK